MNSKKKCLKTNQKAVKLATSGSKNVFGKNVVQKALTMLSVAMLGVGFVGIDKAQAAIFTMQFGKDDNFSLLDGPEEATYQRPESLDWYYNGMFGGNCKTSSWWQQRCEFRKFDETTMNRNFHHSFDLSTPLLYGEIISATFEARFRGYGGNDSMIFGDLVRTDSAGAWGANVFSFFGTTYGQTVDANIDLGNLALNNGSDLLTVMNEVGFLDFHIQDDTMVDFIKLTVETKSTPEPASTLGLLALGGLGVVSKLRNNKKQRS